MALFDPITDGSIKADLPMSEHENAAAILEELERILESPFFRHSSRGKEFLSFVVRQKLEGRAEDLKERSIGITLFRRAPNYSTGDDPIVRVQAGEVRRRLDQYYQSCTDTLAVCIELPVGSYVPEFRWQAPSHPNQEAETGPPVSVTTTSSRSFNLWKLGFLALLLMVIAIKTYTAAMHLFGGGQNRKQATQIAQINGATPVLDEFWAPVFNTAQPIMLYLVQGVTYRPTPEIYDKYEHKHHGLFASSVQRYIDPLPLKPDTTLLWRQMVLETTYGVAVGDVDTAVRVSTFFGATGKPDQVRIGANFSPADFSNFPTILIGGFNNPWTMKLMSGLHFALVDQGDGHFFIREQIPHGREWYLKKQQPQKDYAVVTRLMNSDTGHFIVIVAGITGVGTEAAGNFVTNEQVLADGVRSLPNGWQNKNLQLVIETKLTDSIPGAARVVASYSW